MEYSRSIVGRYFDCFDHVDFSFGYTAASAVTLRGAAVRSLLNELRLISSLEMALAQSLRPAVPATKSGCGAKQTPEPAWLMSVAGGKPTFDRRQLMSASDRLC